MRDKLNLPDQKCKIWEKIEKISENIIEARHTYIWRNKKKHYPKKSDQRDRGIEQNGGFKDGPKGYKALESKMQR